MATGNLVYPPTPRLRTVPLPPLHGQGQAGHAGVHAFCLHSLFTSGHLVYDASSGRFTTISNTYRMDKGILDAPITHPALCTLGLRFARFPREWDVSVTGSGGPVTVAHILHALPKARALATGRWIVRLEHMAGDDFVVFLTPTTLT
ncbi:hypothetical protein AURDEDRAFT_160272 [Auricularia subglabra TFB-10046 SS5]|nr:hypothetical protein AURDEDRAFT_160272 [Auricularia subglabra TFB-10046 SS5]